MFGHHKVPHRVVRILKRTTTSSSSTTKSGNGKLSPRPSRLAVYAELSKARLSSLVVLTTGAGFVCAGPMSLDLPLMATACIGTGLCAASAGTYNQIFEKERDARMNRTKRRPLPSGDVTTFEAAGWGIATGSIGTGMLMTLPNPNVAALGAFNIALYAGIYTFSKPRSELNTWIGSLVGAIPPVMGWMAAGGGALDGQAISLATLLLLWQFPHFFALSWLHREDYMNGGFKMVSSSDPTGFRTGGLILEYSSYLAMFPLLSCAAGHTSPMFLLEASAANAYLLYLAKEFKANRSNANARKVFLCSLWYLPLLLTAYVFHSREWNESTVHEDHVHDEISSAFLGVKKRMKTICMHEVIVSNQSTDAAHHCAAKMARAATAEVISLSTKSTSPLDREPNVPSSG
jgi:protoheme IX farnesyltransferase